MLLLPFVLLVYASTEVTKNVVLLPERATESFEQIIKYVLGQKMPKCLFWEKPYITLVVTSKIKSYSGRPVLRNVNLASRLNVLCCVLAPANSLCCRFLYFSP